MHSVNSTTRGIMLTPAELRKKIPCTEPVALSVQHSREAIKNILDRKDPRMFIVVGPCSIHDPVAGIDYAKRLRKLQDEVSDVLLLVMRVYFEKPRTTTGWKGLINDPYLDGTYQVEEGMVLARRFLLDVCKLDLTTATEALDPISPLYLSDLVSWYAIGARTVESQTHREMASCLPAPVAFKNGTSGDVETAINAIQSAAHPHTIVGINENGRLATVDSWGNRYGHLVMRGGNSGPNYDSISVSLAEESLKKAKLPTNIVIDCSHANSNKNPALQSIVMDDVLGQVCNGNQSIVGMMLESNLVSGHQPIPNNLSLLKYGCSVTDACMDWEVTAEIIKKAARRLRQSPRIVAHNNYELSTVEAPRARAELHFANET
ncbi:3-deoxy-7-phosphoheptulonate synthase [Aeromonas veronii]|uniref:3-deoxy-7-phosphoheptulonate synthase n=1 Tax=Aeromonas veronii TaxID=654 RepID=UPI001934B517|nr:3-deoxy-7-phosphoheptulonate synthase [Aeromonas veronii]MBM0419447.1 3-deoxy-7-phosphoheptulonate synthase [Aeromonas veronii]MBW3791238.1 3-deoxy-7-phosphoheptulonate synthase [Aeromonas veronii]